MLNKIDLIDEDTVKDVINHFSKDKNCEVMTMTTLDKESVSKIKQRRIVKVADHLLCEYFPGRECRFDIVSIILNNKEVKIAHISDAFLPEINISY